jgi:hypothetical protein
MVYKNILPIVSVLLAAVDARYNSLEIFVGYIVADIITVLGKKMQCKQLLRQLPEVLRDRPLLLLDNLSAHSLRERMLVLRSVPIFFP